MKRPPLGDIADTALAVLVDALDGLEAAGTTHWLTYGTLLGLVRDGAMLPHDHDIDIAILAGSDPARIREAMAERGFVQVSEQHDRQGPAKQKFQRDLVLIDLFFVQPSQPFWLDHGSLRKHSEMFGSHLPVTVETSRFGGVDVPVPRETEAYLAHLYGPRWRTPVRQWHWVLSPPNVELHLHWTDAIWLWRERGRWRRRLARDARA